MKKIYSLLTVFMLLSISSIKAQNFDIEAFPDKDLFGNYVIVRITPLCTTKAEAVNEMNKFKTWCEENTYVKPYTASVGYFQVKSIEKDKTDKWFGGYCNYKRQIKELYDEDKRFIQMYCSSTDIYQFKELIKTDNCPVPGK
jgi:hypothetical protein